LAAYTVDIADEVDQVIAEVRPELPRGVKVERVYNQAAFVRGRSPMCATQF